MTATLRAFLAALIVAGAAFTGAWYIGAAGSFPRNDPPTTVGDGGELVALAFQEVQRSFYKDVDPQTLIDGERRGLLAYLRDSLKKQRVTPALPAETASTNEATDVHLLKLELSQAQARYGARLHGSTQALTEAALKGMLKSLGDPYTTYLPPDEYTGLNESLSGGNFGGVGVFIYQLKTSPEIVLQAIPDLPASRSGMHGSEVLVRINGQSIAGWPLDRIERAIRGPRGTVVTLTTHPYKGSTMRRYRITREIIHVPTVHAKMENGFEYIHLSDFGDTSAQEVRTALLDGRRRGAKGYIFDLRDNGGGLVDAAVKISSFFIPSGVIVTEIDRDGNRQSQGALGTFIPGLKPLAVLVNGYTASASEITAGAIEDHRVGTLIGQRTFGKGVVQGIFRMPNGGALKITTQRYLTPAGRDIQHHGIAPEVSINQRPDLEIMDTPADKQLQAAKAFLKHLVR